jgi:hypothetical protein
VFFQGRWSPLALLRPPYTARTTRILKTLVGFPENRIGIRRYRNT